MATRHVRAYDYVRNHCKVGDTVVLESGKSLLVGDVNILGGVCDDCTLQGSVEASCGEDCCSTEELV